MSKIAFQAALYDVLIEGNDLILQGTTQDVIFPDGYLLIRETAEDEFFSLEYAGQRLAGFISDYIDSNIELWLKANQEIGVVVVHNLN
jgi:hypothetical protein